MQFISQIISENLTYALGWTVIHSLWQGLLIAFVCGLLLMYGQKKSARWRYAISFGALLSFFIISFGTFFALLGSATTALSEGGEETLFLSMTFSGEIEGSGSIFQQWFDQLILYFNENLQVIVGIWALGIVFFSLRMAGAYLYVQRLRKSYNQPLSDKWQLMLSKLTRRIPIHKTVQLVESTIVKTPMMIGFLKPMILLPVGTVNHLNPKEVEAILAHELAHIFRNDYVLNILQTLIEVLFYFHPAVWWISANIRKEREVCCDELAVKLCGSSLDYAKALMRIQELHHTAPVLSMSFSGKKNQLLFRIKHILNQPNNKSHLMEKIMATCVLLLGVLILSMNVNSHAKESDFTTEAFLELIDHELEVEYPKLETFTIVPDTVIPKNKSKNIRQQRIIQNQKGKEDVQYDITVEDGEITELLINGEPVPSEEYKNYEEITNGEDGSFIISSPSSIPTEPVIRAFHSRIDMPLATPSSLIKIGEENELILKTPSAIMESNEGTIVTTSKNEEGETIFTIKNLKSGEQEIIEMEVVDPDEMIIVKDGKVIIGGDTVIKGNKQKGYSYSFQNGSYSDNFNHGSNSNKEELYERLADIQEQQKELVEQKEALAKLYQQQSAESAEKARAKAIELLAEVKALENESREIEREMVKKERDIARGYQSQARSKNWAVKPKTKNFQSVLEKSMLSDGLISDDSNYKFELDNKKLKINGKKVSDQLWTKYKSLYESLSGNKLSEKGRVTIEVEEIKKSKNNNINIDCNYKH